MIYDGDLLGKRIWSPPSIQSRTTDSKPTYAVALVGPYFVEPRLSTTHHSMRIFNDPSKICGFGQRYNPELIVFDLGGIPNPARIEWKKRYSFDHSKIFSLDKDIEELRRLIEGVKIGFICYEDQEDQIDVTHFDEGLLGTVNKKKPEVEKAAMSLYEIMMRSC